ncbi:MAG: DUF4340 domain-containing protein [bacterium]|nr:DUF4340 domain-containing protein [bacterium]
MMKTKNLIILAAVLLVLAGVSFMQKSQHEKTTSQAATAVLLEGSLSLDNLTEISLGLGSETDAVVLTKSNDGWVVKSYFNAKANEQRIQSLLQPFSNLSGEFRSDNESVLADYSLTTKQAITIRALDTSGQEAFALNLGTSPEGFQGQFMRLPTSNKVYLSQSSLLAGMGIYGELALPKAQHFLELQAVKENGQTIDGMTITDGATSQVFSKKHGVIEPAENSPEGTTATEDRSTWEWLLAGEAATGLAKTKIDAVLNSAVSIRANDVVDGSVDLAQYGLVEPSRKVTLQRADANDLVLLFGNSREASDGLNAGTFMKLDGQSTVWVVTDYTTGNLFKSLDELSSE